MRTGMCTIQQALTPESATVVKQAVTLARRRGHAQVTPLHVASAMLASPTGLLRMSCLNSHSHPLQCKALELCFNVALNRLPAAATSGPILGGPHLPSHPPSLSNALVAAFKRAQAHQRRGSVESQQQPILALKIELEQLVISILDDPSVSRVMREAGFSSAHVKSRVEQAVSIEVCSRDPPRPKNGPMESPRLIRTSSGEEMSSRDDASSVVDAVMGKKRNTVVIGECVASAESVVKAFTEKQEVKSSVQFISFPVLSMRNLSREEMEQKLIEIRGILRGSYIGRGIVLYLGDIEGISEFWLNHVEGKRGYYFCSLENVVMEIKKWVCGVGETKRVWALGVATYSAYMKCKGGQPSLESVWELHPLTIPAGSLSLTLNLSSVFQHEVRTESKTDIGSKWTLFGKGESNKLACCTDCTLNFNKEVQGMSTVRTGTSSLPSWLQQYKEEKTRDSFGSHQGNVNIKNLCKKWSSFCSAFHKHSLQYPEKLLRFSSTPCSPTSSSPSSTIHHTHLSWPQLKEAGNSNDHDDKCRDTKPDLLSNPNSSPNSASSSEIMEDSADYSPAFNEHSAENLKILTDALEAKVPWQKDVIPEMVNTVLHCRSRKLKESTWMAFLGPDSTGKEKVARELGKTVYGSHTSFVLVGNAGDSTGLPSRKRPREEAGGDGYLRRFMEVVNENPHRVFFLEAFDQFDEVSRVGVKRAIRSGKLSICSGEFVSLRDAIVIISCRSSGLSTGGGSPKGQQVISYAKEVGENREEEEDDDNGGDPDEKWKVINSVSLDLNVAIEDVEDYCDDDVESGILDLVDGKFFFKIQEV